MSRGGVLCPPRPRPNAEIGRCLEAFAIGSTLGDSKTRLLRPLAALVFRDLMLRLAPFPVGFLDLMLSLALSPQAPAT